MKNILVVLISLVCFSCLNVYADRIICNNGSLWFKAEDVKVTKASNNSTSYFVEDGGRTYELPVNNCMVSYSIPATTITSDKE